MFLGLIKLLRFCQTNFSLGRIKPAFFKPRQKTYREFLTHFQLHSRNIYSMRIAQIAPLWEPVPPFRYGGTELIVSLVTDELVRRGHEVTLFASGDSITKAQLEFVHEQALRLDKKVKEPVLYEQMMLAKVYHQAH